MKGRKSFEIEQSAPNWLKPKVKSNKVLRNTFNVFGKWHEHMWGKDYLNALKSARDKMDAIEVDRTRVKPVVKITGEFWAQTTEGDGNFHMFEFLEREGAQVMVEPIATWVAYLMYQAKAHAKAKWPVNRPHRTPEWHEFKKQFANWIGLRKKLWGIGAGQRMWNFFYHRTIKNLGGITHHLVPQQELADLAHPFYNQFARGGEGHLEVGKNVYYTVHKLTHMVLALKPFGCMPSSQSDGVQSAVINKFKDMIFLPIETSGEGEVNAHSRVQMALGEAKVKAKAEFEQCLKSTGKSMAEIREYINEHPELKRPFYHVPHREGVAGTAAQFILHVSDRIDKDTRFWKKSRVRVAEAAPAMSGD
jgi:predicted nucleotide-binding protein (sugar kinase/HSP70/actin superfamily)